MTYEERRLWIYLISSAAAYLVYLAIVWSRADGTSVAHVSYISALLWTTVASIVVAMIGRMAVESSRSRQERRTDERDREIDRSGEYASRWFVIAAATAGLFMAMARWDYFWIANVLYLGFVLWAVVGSALKLVAYRRGV